LASLPESAKDAIRKKISELKGRLEKQEEKPKEEAKEEKGSMSDANIRSEIEKQERKLNLGSLPESAKDAIRKKIEQLKGQLSQEEKPAERKKKKIIIPRKDKSVPIVNEPVSKTKGKVIDKLEEIEEEEVEVEEEDDVVEDDEFDLTEGYVSDEVIEEELISKKTKKKKAVVLVSPAVFNLPAEKQLNAHTERNTLRLEILEKLKTLFNLTLTSSEVDSLEDEIYKASLLEATKRHTVKIWLNPVYKNIYTAMLRKVIGNLHGDSYVQNKELLQRYKSKEITFTEICAMNHYELYKSKWNDSIVHQQMVEKRQLEGNKAMATEQFLCTKCFKRECTYYEMQTRSADEPMTIFISCLNCGKHWRQ
jgi:DNA-directed RNA polymerase subunit M/transcription elongation factor TFIIS